MRIELVKLLDETRFQGQPRGTRHFGRVCQALSGVSLGETVLLDFSGVDVLTGSWISAMLLQLVRWGGTPEIELFFVLVGLTAEHLEELRYVSGHAHTVFLVATRAKSPSRATLVGQLDPGQRETLAAVIKLGEATGATLEREHPDTKATAWNNRLRDLYERKRILKRRKQGREQIYRPIVPEISIDG